MTKEHGNQPVIIARGEPMTRTERAACELALCVLRARVLDDDEAHAALDDALTVLWIGWHGWETWSRHHHIAAAVASLTDLSADLFEHVERAPRLLRARLALYLRALLRADRGDCGPWRCPVCALPWTPEYGPSPHPRSTHFHCGLGATPHPSGTCHDGERVARYGRRITPLWQQAGEASR
jgi:hypothetical protein